MTRHQAQQRHRTFQYGMLLWYLAHRQAPKPWDDAEARAGLKRLLGYLPIAGGTGAGAMGAIRIAFAVGSILAAMLPKPPTPMLELKYSTTEQGRPLPFGYGTFPAPGNLVWVSGFTQINPSGKGGKGGGGEKLGKGGGAGQQPVYVVSFAFTFAEGPVDYVTIWQDNKVALTSGQTQQSLSSPGKSGKFGKGIHVSPGTMTWYRGDGSNVADPTIAASKNTGIGGATGVTPLTDPFTAQPNGTFTVRNPPVTAGSDAVWYTTTGPAQAGGDAGNVGTQTNFAFLVRVGSAPTYGQYTINDTTGLITLGPGYVDATGVNQAWSGQALNVSYQSALIGTAADTLTPGYPFFGYGVFAHWIVGSAARVPNMRAELNKQLPVIVPNLWGQVRGYSSQQGNIWETSDGLTFTEDNPPAPAVIPSVFWADENNLDAGGRMLTMAAISAGAVIYYSTNSGTTWTTAPTVPPGFADTWTVCILPDGTLVVFSSTALPVVYRSTDGGTTWSSAIPLPSAEGINGDGCILMGQPVRDSAGNLLHCGINYGYAATLHGNGQFAVWRSTDKGQTWSIVFNELWGGPGLSAPNPIYGGLSYKHTSSGDVFLFAFSISNAAWAYVQRSTNGTTWTQVLTLYNNAPNPSQAIAWAYPGSVPGHFLRNNPAWMANGDWVVYSYDGSFAPHAWRSTDNGVTWASDDGSVLPVQHSGDASSMIAWGTFSRQSTSCGTPVGAAGYTWGATFSLNGDASGAGIYYSTDSGHTWTAYSAWSDFALGSMFAPNLVPSVLTPDANPADIIKDLLTNTRYGASIPSGEIDATTFATAQAYYAANTILLSPVFMAHQPVLSHLESVLILCDSWLVYSQGLFRLVPRQAPQTVIPITTAAYTRNRDDVELTKLGPDNLVNRVVVQYLQRSKQQQALVQISGQTGDFVPVNLAQGTGPSIQTDWYERETQEARSGWMIQGDAGQAIVGDRGGNGVELIVGAEGVCIDSLAAKIAYRTLWTRAFARFQATIPLGPKHSYVQPTDVLQWTDADLGVSGLLMRVLAIQEDELGRLSCECVEENPTFLGWGIGNNVGVSSAKPILPAGNAPPAIVSVREMAPPEAQGNGSIVVLAGGVSSAFSGALVYGSTDNTTYDLVAGTPGTPVGYLVEALPFGRFLDAVNTVHVKLLTPNVTLVTTTDPQFRAGANSLLIDDELIYFMTATLVAPNEWKLTGLLRGLYGTTPAAHVVNAATWVTSTSELILTPLQQSDGSLGVDTGIQPLFAVPVALPLIGTPMYFKAAALNAAGGQQDLATVTPVTITYQARGGRPMDVEGLVAAGGYGDGDFDVEVTGTPNRNLVLSWQYQSPAIQEDTDLTYGVISGYDAQFYRYVVTIADAAGNVKATYDSVTNPSMFALGGGVNGGDQFTYTEAQNAADFGAWSSIVQVTVVVQALSGIAAFGMTDTFQMIH